jgi:hypothetical protein
MPEKLPAFFLSLQLLFKDGSTPLWIALSAFPAFSMLKKGKAINYLLLIYKKIFYLCRLKSQHSGGKK